MDSGHRMIAATAVPSGETARPYSHNYLVVFEVEQWGSDCLWNADVHREQGVGTVIHDALADKVYAAITGAVGLVQSLPTSAFVATQVAKSPSQGPQR